MYISNVPIVLNVIMVLVVILVSTTIILVCDCHSWRTTEIWSQCLSSSWSVRPLCLHDGVGVVRTDCACMTFVMTFWLIVRGAMLFCGLTHPEAIAAARQKHRAGV